MTMWDYADKNPYWFLAFVVIVALCLPSFKFVWHWKSTKRREDDEE